MKKNTLKLQDTLQKLLLSISDNYYIDYYLTDFKLAKGVNLHDRSKIINNTVKKYKEHHIEFPEKLIKFITEELNEIIKKDTVIHFEDTFIYKELYKILMLINSTFTALDFINSDIYPCKFAEIQSNLQKVELFQKHNKKNIVGHYRLHKSLRGQSRFRRWFSTLYLGNKELAKFFTHLFLTADIEKVKEFHEDEKDTELLLNELNYILTQRTVDSKIIKSLGILLYWDMRTFLKIDKENAEVYTKAIIYELFKENFNAEELEKIIEIKSSLGFLPIFGASKKASLKENEKLFIHDRLLREIQETSSITKEEFEPFFDSYIKTPHIQFLHKYPVELFRLNPKYSPILEN